MAHRAVIFAIAQLYCYFTVSILTLIRRNIYTIFFTVQVRIRVG